MQFHTFILVLTLTALITACGSGGKKKHHSSSIASSQAVSSAATSSASSVVLSSANSSSNSLSLTAFIVVDQFGYLPDAQKIAVIRDPQTGYDAAQSFSPGASLSLVNATSGETVLSAAPVVWNGGATDTSSGDKAWWFDFSSVTTAGTYYVIDIAQNVRSPSFKIATDVYKPVLKHALRTFFYQRAGFAKEIPYADAAWADGASHIGAGQDTEARIYNDKSNTATAKDLSGGWYDAGDYNKYTTWQADYVVTLLHAYLENPAAWTDDFNIPESGNDIPDILDEIKWGMDWLKKMQDATGNNSVLSIVGLWHHAGSLTSSPPASPPSLATEASYYGTASTNATMSAAAAFALGSTVFDDVPAWTSYAADLKVRAENAWAWADANPGVLFFNNDNSRTPGSADLGAGQQEPLDYSTTPATPDVKARATKKRIAAVYLFAATGGAAYKTHIEADYVNADLKTFSDSFREMENTSLLYYASLADVTPTVATTINTWFKNDMNTNDNWLAMTTKRDPYMAYINWYGWGSNSTKSAKGSMFMDLIEFNLSGFDAATAKNSALTYVNYLHGVNPQGMVYLSNMYSLGVHSSVNEFYHTWFGDGSVKWDRVGTSTYGPAPGFLVGGPNPSYDWDSNCTSGSPNSGCGSAAPNPPKGQPAQKSYKDFNTSWPINSWSVTENSCGYQSNYLRLLSKFVN
ncbi:MAG: glycoside hydrolase family 9 protein [Pseudomonadota bacterium]